MVYQLGLSRAQSHQIPAGLSPVPCPRPLVASEAAESMVRSQVQPPNLCALARKNQVTRGSHHAMIGV